MLRLRQIELLGFKSFPHKTVVDFDAGVTCIVGPNGSGKSNLADAINFAFGSQSGRELRAHKLAGLIFAGTDQLRPLNLASVTLHFERTAAELVSAEDSLAGLAALAGDELELPEVAIASQPAGSQLIDGDGFRGTDLTRHQGINHNADYDRTPAVIKQLGELAPGQRISLTRRVFRDGSGGYFINDQAVRLKDIDTLFNRYNLGRSAVFAINQGEVEKKILETPQELRGWLAEATGVALLLMQKQRAQGKLKRTRQNLERLEDIRSNERELVADLTGQRQRAEEYIRLRDQLKSVELNEIRREVEFGQRQQESAAKSLDELAAQLADRRTEHGQRQEAYKQNQQARREAEEQLSQGESRLAAQRDELAQLSQDGAVARRAAAAALSAIEQAEQDAAALDLECEKAEAELLANAEQAGLLAQELEAVLVAEAASRAAFETAQAEEGELAAGQAELANLGFELAQQEAALSNRLESLARSRQQLDAQLEERGEQLAAATARLDSLESELGQHQRQAEELALEVGTRRDQLEQHQKDMEQLGARIAAADEECAKQRDRLAQLNERRRTIAELAEEAEDPESGAARLLADPALAKQLARVSEVAFPQELRPAFTRLLAHLGDALAAADVSRGRLLEALSAAGAEALVLSGGESPELHPDSLWHKLEAPEPVKAGLIAVLGDVALASDLDSAEALLAQVAGLDAVVLADGSALIARGYAYLGAVAPERALKVTRLSDLAHLDAQIAQAAEELTRAEDELGELRAQQAQGQWDRDELSALLAAAEERLRQALLLSDRLLKTVEERRSEHELLSHQQRRLSADRAQLETDEPETQDQLAETRAARQAARVRAEELAAGRELAQAALEEARTVHARAVTARELMEQRTEHLRQAGLDLAERASNLRNRRRLLAERIAGLERERADNLNAAEAAAARALELEAALAQAGDELSQLRARRTELLDGAEELQGDVARTLAEISRLEQDEVAQQAVRDRAVERVAEWLEDLRERYGLSLSELLSDPAVTAPPPGAELDASEAGRGRLREEKARLSEALLTLGDVNLLAIEQHQEHSQRLAFLDAQAAELTRATADLEQLITDLDSTTEQRYRGSLRQIEQRFNETYLKLFGSGWARLRFEDPEAIIDSGVEIEVQLPAGRRHSLRSLSGGQRSLIFLALFFAVHSVRSPGFCILDEADAALDDANVERFAQMLRSVRGAEQFVVITHNKSTMETADKLIGVVGRPKGVSNLLSVDLKEARKLVDRTVA